VTLTPTPPHMTASHGAEVATPSRRKASVGGTSLEQMLTAREGAAKPPHASHRPLGLRAAQSNRCHPSGWAHSIAEQLIRAEKSPRGQLSWLTKYRQHMVAGLPRVADDGTQGL